MQDAITTVINSADVQGKYLDESAMDKLKGYFATGELRVRAATTGRLATRRRAEVWQATRQPLRHA